MKQKASWLIQSLLVFLEFILTNFAYCQLTTSYNDKACPGFEVLTCRGIGNIAEWRIFPHSADFVLTDTVSSSSRSSLIPLGFRGETATATFTSDTQTGNFTSMLFVLITSGLEGATLSCRNIENHVFGNKIIQLAGVPSAPNRFRQFNQQISSSSVDVIISWDPPNNTSGAPVVNYAVTISPFAQLSAEVVTSTTIAVAAINYNTEYNVRVVAFNCIGGSPAGEFSLKVGRCPIPVAPISGSISPVDVGGRLVGSTVTFQCDSGFEPRGLVTAICGSTLMWSPGPITFRCTQTRTQSTETFSTVQLAIGIVVTLVLSLTLGIAAGVCVTCLSKCKQSTPAMDQMSMPSEPAEYAEVGRNTWTIGINTAYSTTKQY